MRGNAQAAGKLNVGCLQSFAVIQSTQRLERNDRCLFKREFAPELFRDVFDFL